jgi:hypothetical protein
MLQMALLRTEFEQLSRRAFKEPVDMELFGAKAAQKQRPRLEPFRDLTCPIHGLRKNWDLPSNLWAFAHDQLC